MGWDVPAFEEAFEVKMLFPVEHSVLSWTNRKPQKVLLDQQEAHNPASYWSKRGPFGAVASHMVGEASGQWLQATSPK
jgi:hypothetical protein